MNKRRENKRSRITPGTDVEYDEKVYRISDLVDETKATAIDRETGRLTILPLADVFIAERSKSDAPRRAIDGLTEKDKRIAAERLNVLRPLLDMEHFGATEVEARAQEVGVNPVTIYRWLKRYRNSHDITSLVPQKRGWRSGNTRIPTFAEDVISKVLDEFYLTKLRPSVQTTVQEVHRQCQELRIKPPGASTIRARINKIDEEERLRRRGQRERARNLHQPVPGHFPNADYPLAVVQIDHTKVDLMLVDDTDRLPIGRPWITLAIDVFSRVVTGYYLSFDAPSVTSVGMCLAHSILAKEDWLMRHKVEAEWPVWGFPETIHVDNGPDFRSRDLKFSCAMHGISIEFRPVGTPHFGGHIERLIGTLMKDLQGLPGATFSSVADRGEQDPENSAALTKTEFEKWLLTHICKLYHHRRHGGIGIAPLQMWRDGILGTKESPGRGGPAQPSNPEDLVRDFLPVFERTIQRAGVRIQGLHYFANSLSPWIGARDPNDPKRPRKFIFRRDPRDITKVWFYEPKLDQYCFVPPADQSLHHMSVWEYRRVRKRLSDRGVTQPTTAQLLIAFTEEREIVELSQGKTKKAKLARMRRQKRAEHKDPVTPVSKVQPDEEPADSAEISDMSYEPVEPFDDIR